MKDSAIGIYDSGYGGLTVLKEMLELAPNGNFIYLGDNLRIPYGDKTKEEIIEFSKEAMDFFKMKDVKSVVLACNTVSAQALDEMKKCTDVPVIGIGEMGAKGAVRETENKKVLVLATKGTIKSGLYERCIHKLDDEVEVRGIGCQKLVPIIESKKDEDTKKSLIVDALEEYREMVKDYDYDTIVLGCTHYPYALEEIREVFGKDKKIVNPSKEQAKMVIEKYSQETLRKNGNFELYTTGDKLLFKEFAENYLGESVLVHNIKLRRKL